MIPGFSTISRQVRDDFCCVYSLFRSKTSSSNSGDRGVKLLYATMRLGFAAAMIGSVVQGLVGLITLNLPLVAFSVISFIAAHDCFHFLKNRQTLEEKGVGVLETISVVGKGILSGAKEMFKSAWQGKDDEEITTNTLRAAFKEAASLQSKNTILKPLWDEIQFQLAIRDYNPFPWDFKKTTPWDIK